VAAPDRLPLSRFRLPGQLVYLYLAAPIFLWISRKYYSGPPRQRAYVAPAVQAEE